VSAIFINLASETRRYDQFFGISREPLISFIREFVVGGEYPAVDMYEIASFRIASAYVAMRHPQRLADVHLGLDMVQADGERSARRWSFFT